MDREIIKRRVLKKKYRKLLFAIKKLFNIGLKVTIVLLAVLLVKDKITTVNAKNAIKEDEIMLNYIECLKDNFTQRDYCSRKVSNTNYRILDQKLEKYGYKYKQVGYDLYLVNIDE